MSRSRRNLLIVLSIFWLLISWLVASLRPGADWAVILSETLQIFIPGLLLLSLVVSVELMRAEKHTAVIRKDIFGGVDAFSHTSFLYIPFFYEIVARMPVAPIRFEVNIKKVDTRTLKLAAIPLLRVRCNYQISDYKTCLAQAELREDRLREIEAEHRSSRTEASMWPLLLEELVGQLIDDNLRATVWAWQRAVESDRSLMFDPFSIFVPRQLPPNPPTLPTVLENDPYDLSVNREKLSRVLEKVLGPEGRKWGLTIRDVVIEYVEVGEELIKARTRNKDGEVAEAQHKGKLDYYEIKYRGMAEAEVRALTVKRILDALVTQQGLPPITENMVADIVRSAMYSDGEMIWKGVLEKSSGPPAAATEKSGTPVKTA